ncbi:MAG: hypothetical protein ACR2HG_04250 [Pyrinomonadaceae bacterium]
MQVKKKRTETVSETTTLLFLKNLANGTRRDWCEQCAAEVFWIARGKSNCSVFPNYREAERFIKTAGARVRAH